LAILQQYKRVLCIFSLRMHRNSYLGASGKKSDPAIRSGDVDFLLQGNNSSIGIYFPRDLAIFC